MSSWDSADTEECDDIFMSMFTHRDAKDEKFYFKDIIISQDSLTFKFSFCNEIDFNSVVLLDMPLDERNLNVMRTVFSIGDQNIHPDAGLLVSDSKRTPKHSVIIPMGGGKDSLVVWHEYKQAHPHCTSLLLYVADGFDEYAQSWRLQGVMTQTADDLVLVRHDFQNTLLHQMKRSYLKPCAHPWAALVLFDSLLMAQLTGISEVTLGYERSADEGNKIFVPVPLPLSPSITDSAKDAVVTDDQQKQASIDVVLEEVNHQYDKSSTFLAQAQGYIKAFVDRDVKVVSTLHGLWELQISKIFCDAPKLRPFLPMFLSCNEPTATCDWCKRCDKCAFIFLLLSAHLPPTEVVHTVFGGVNMLDSTQYSGLFMRLVGGGSAGKPLDCVGTVQEASAAVHLSAVQYSQCATWRETCSMQETKKSCDTKDRHDNSECDSSHCDYSQVRSTEQECSVGIESNDSVIDCSAAAPPLPVVLWELCKHLHIQCDKDSGAPVVSHEERILKMWGICDGDALYE